MNSSPEKEEDDEARREEVLRLLRRAGRKGGLLKRSRSDEQLGRQLPFSAEMEGDTLDARNEYSGIEGAIFNGPDYFSDDGNSMGYQDLCLDCTHSLKFIHLKRAHLFKTAKRH